VDKAGGESVYRTKAREITPAEVHQLFEGDFADTGKQLTGEMSIQDRRFLSVMQEIE
jgi:hypothetical protein